MFTVHFSGLFCLKLFGHIRAYRNSITDNKYYAKFCIVQFNDYLKKYFLFPLDIQ